MGWQKKHCIQAVAMCLALLAPAVHADSDALVVKRPAELRESPGEASRSVVSLPAKTPVTRLPARLGAWVQVKLATGQTGWLHMFDIGTAESTSTVASTAQGALRGLTSFFNRGSAQTAANTTATSTVGIRGLGAEDIANAQPNLQALAQADAMRTDPTQARRFAADAALQTRPVDPLPEPSAPASGNTN